MGETGTETTRIEWWACITYDQGKLVKIVIAV